MVCNLTYGLKVGLVSNLCSFVLRHGQAKRGLVKYGYVYLCILGHFKSIKKNKPPFRIHSSKSKPLTQSVLSRTSLKLKNNFKLEDEI